jgi:hypothetical protein
MKFAETWQQNYSQDPPSGRKTKCVAVITKHPIKWAKDLKENSRIFSSKRGGTQK